MTNIEEKNDVGLADPSISQMLAVIYEEIADKTLSFGCKLTFSSMGMWGHKASTYIRVINNVRNNIGGSCLDDIFSCTNRGWSHTPYHGWKPKEGYAERAELLKTKDGKIKTLGMYHDDIKILGHDVYIGDVIGWIEKKAGAYDFEFSKLVNKLSVRIRNRPTKPIEDQSIECITFVYNLCKQS